MPNIDNPWPERQAHEQAIAAQLEADIETWKANNFDNAVAVVYLIKELQDEFESEFDFDMGQDIQAFFGITRKHLSDYEQRRQRKG